METQGTSLQEPPSVDTVGGNSGSSDVICKCGEGWTCVITRTEGPDAGKAFFKCGENCTCVIDGTVDGDPNVKQKLENFSGGAFCKCGEEECSHVTTPSVIACGKLANEGALYFASNL
ncbi:hypothetical protein CMV_016303 [Castanea mollissima]|uniref:Uncharacterized protein n=1 Tax=Castanea mollissima TaxID=60419 RepID=A0A8J4VFA0_9ROSI|nr:hypothetical protein CMV_016303 [Castanea mollissima]